MSIEPTGRTRGTSTSVITSASRRRLHASSIPRASPSTAPLRARERSEASSSGTFSGAATRGPRTRSTAGERRRRSPGRTTLRGIEPAVDVALHLRPRRRGVRCGRGCADGGNAIDLRRVGRVRGERRRGPGEAGRLLAPRAGARWTTGRPELSRRRGRRRTAERDVRGAGPACSGTWGSRRRAARSASRSSNRRASAGSGSPPSCRSGTRPMSLPTTCSSTGRTTTRPSSSRSISRASATRPTSAGSPAVSLGRSPCSR